jgi:hypothetical protein
VLVSEFNHFESLSNNWRGFFDQGSFPRRRESRMTALDARLHGHDKLNEQVHQTNTITKMNNFYFLTNESKKTAKKGSQKLVLIRAV